MRTMYGRFFYRNMKKLFFVILGIVFSVCVSAQNAGELYQQYELALSQGDYKKAFSALSECDNLCNHSPLSSFSLALMYLIGEGTQIDTTQAMVYASFTGSYDYRRNHPMDFDRFGERMGLSTSAIQQMKDDFNEQNRQYDLYMKQPIKYENIMKAFSNRWLGYFSFMYINSSADYEENLANASSALSSLQKADSLSSDVYSLYLLGRIYYEGLLGYKEKEKGLRYIELSASRGCLSALTYLGEIKYKQGEEKSAKRLWKEAARTEVYPLVHPTRRNILYFNSPNIDIGDVREMKQRAIHYLKK